MNEVVVITGGAGGMGLAVAKIMGQDHRIVLCDINQQRLDSAAAELKLQGIDCSTVVCDIADRASVNATFQHARARGEIKSVIHIAGLSPQMADADTIMRVNALGTINVTEASYATANAGFVLVNIASMAAHILPPLLIPKRAYSYALSDTTAFLKKMLWPCRFMPNGFYRAGMAYAISKHFVMWYCRRNAARFGDKGARILSISPGSFDTAMGRLEEKSGSAEMAKKAALKRFGTPNEIAELIAFCASDKASYLTGVDILCDGGVVASRT